MLQIYVDYSIKNQVIRKHFPKNTLSFEELLNKIDLLLLNDNPVLTDVRPTAPNTIYVGGGIHIDKPKPLPQVLELIKFIRITYKKFC